jgi:hypothetical protein
VTDSEILIRAAKILQERSAKPQSFLLGVICKVLKDTGEKIRSTEETEKGQRR